MKLSIPKPCNENWNEMTPQQQGAFCKVCAKVVVDFSSMSDEEVLRYFENKKEEKTCGRFRVSQLSPYEVKVNLQSVAAQRSFPKIFAASLFIFFSSLFVCKSDTGEPMMLNVIPVDTLDTVSKVLRTDTLSVTQTDSIETPPMIMGGMKPPVVEDIPADTIKTITGDTVVEPMTVGELVLPPPPPPMIMGKMVCTKPKQENKPTKQKPVERKVKGDVIMLGDVKF
jgi:hypothetical protein